MEWSEIRKIVFNGALVIILIALISIIVSKVSINWFSAEVSTLIGTLCGILGGVAAWQVNRIIKRIDDKLDRCEFLEYKSQDKEVHEEFKTILENIEKKYDTIISHLIK